jgi:hypothetical protein
MGGSFSELHPSRKRFPWFFPDLSGLVWEVR